MSEEENWNSNLDEFLQTISEGDEDFEEELDAAPLEQKNIAKPKRRTATPKQPTQRKQNAASGKATSAKNEPKQKTLQQTMTENEINRLFTASAATMKSEGNDDVDESDLSKFLVENEEFDKPEDAGEGTDILSLFSNQDATPQDDTADAIMRDIERRTNASAAAAAAPANNIDNKSAKKAKTQDRMGENEETENFNIALTDEHLDFDPKTGKRKRTNISSTSGKPENATYVTVKKEVEELKLDTSAFDNSGDGETHPTKSSFTGTATDGATPATDSTTFYWFDMKEQHHRLSVDPGAIFLFGKILQTNGRQRSYRSCCIRVRNVQRCVYLLPEEGVEDINVSKAIFSRCSAQGITERRVKFVDRYYAFERDDIPREKTRWAMLRYPGHQPPLTGSTFPGVSAVIGTNTSLLELFLLEKKIMGPCFLSIEGLVPATQRISHCDFEFTLDNPDNIAVDETNRPTPPLNVVSVQLHSQLDQNGAQTEIVAASIAHYPDVNIDETLRTTPKEILVGVRPVPGSMIPFDFESFCSNKGLRSVNGFRDERALLTWVASTLKMLDADIMTGHNFFGYTLDILLRRYSDLGVPGWSSLGRLDLKVLPRFNSTNIHSERDVCVGRLIADSYLLSREYYKSVNYKLQALATQMSLKGIASGDAQFEPGVTVLHADTYTDNKKLFDVVLELANTAVLSVSVISHLDAMRLTKRLTSVAGNLWNRTLNGARSERIEYLLLHSFHDLDFILPDKFSSDRKRAREEEDELDGGADGKRKAKYQGGMVLSPKTGLYSEYILLLDFNSLYPSLIQEFDICFTTVQRGENEEPKIPGPEALRCASCTAEGGPSPCPHRCILPKVIKRLVDSRREVKRLMKSETNPNNLALLEIRQMALKLTANSMYGCLGFVHSRFQAQPLAELVTSQGRDALQRTVDQISGASLDVNYRVIYGDTDSVMIQTGIKDDISRVRALGNDLKKKINKQYKNLEIDIDGVFRAILLLKKKKYAALKVVDWQGEGKVLKQEVKGLDMVRRDWCPLSKSVSDAVLKRVLSADGGEDVLDYIMNYLRDVVNHVRLGDRYTLEQFVISKGLTKEPEAYKGGSFPHATVALRMKQRQELVRVGDLIPYVICDGEKLSDKAYHVDEVRKDNNLRLDAEWYISTQLYPPVLRLCEHIQGFSAAQLSEAMGLEYRQPAPAADDDGDGFNTSDFAHCGLFQNRTLAECFPTALPFQVTCPHCKRTTAIDPHQRVLDFLASPAGTARTNETFPLYICTSCTRPLRITYISNCFVQNCYRVLQQFYGSGGGSAAVRAVRTQFTYYRALFDVPVAPGCPPRVKDCHRRRALRCLGISDAVFTLEQAQQPDIQEEEDPIDPLKEAAEAFYKRIAHLFIGLEPLFKNLRA